MSNVQEVLDTQKQIEDSLFSRLNEFEKQLRLASSDTKPNLEKLSQDFLDFKNIVWTILSSLRSLIQTLLARLDNLDSQSRQNALLFNGIKEGGDDENCSALILDIIQNKMSLADADASLFLVCHRLGPKNNKRNRPILVRFADLLIRNLVWREKKRLKGSTAVVSEFLTKTRQEIFISARKHFGMAHCWTQAGHIFVKPSDNECKRVLSMQELERLMLKFPAAALVRMFLGDHPKQSQSADNSSSAPTSISLSRTSRQRSQGRNAAAAKGKVYK